jgi:hypothetical protein
MWLYIIGVFLLVVGVVGGALSGGIFTIILIPLAAVALISAVLHSMAARKAQATAGGAPDRSESGPRPLPTSHRSNSAPAPSSPEQLADARRQQQ